MFRFSDASLAYQARLKAAMTAQGGMAVRLAPAKGK